MSLIVGRVDGAQVYLFADTEVTPEAYLPNGAKPRHPFLEGTLKVYRLSTTRAIGFAGDIPRFADFFRTIRSDEPSREAAARAAYAQDRGANFDVLFAEIGVPYLLVVRNGKVIEATSAYLGNVDAFSEFQRRFHEKQKPEVDIGAGGALTILRLPENATGESASEETLKLYSDMFTAFHSVIRHRAFRGVGGFVTPLCTTRGRFEYMYYVDAAAPPFTPKPDGQWHAVDFGTAENRGWQLDFISVEPTGPIGAHCFQGEFGIVFEPDENGLMTGVVMRGVSPVDFAFCSNKRFGAPLLSSRLSVDLCAVAGEKALEEGRFEDAVFYYDLRKDPNILSKRPLHRDRYFTGFAIALNATGKKPEAISLLRWITGEQSAPKASRLLDQLEGERER